MDRFAVPHVPGGQAFGQATLCDVAPVVVPQVPAGQTLVQVLLPWDDAQVAAGHNEHD